MRMLILVMVALMGLMGVSDNCPGIVLVNRE
jgi:hypothetical protein